MTSLPSNYVHLFIYLLLLFNFIPPICSLQSLLRIYLDLLLILKVLSRRPRAPDFSSLVSITHIDQSVGVKGLRWTNHSVSSHARGVSSRALGNRFHIYLRQSQRFSLEVVDGADVSRISGSQLNFCFSWCLKTRKCLRLTNK